MPLSPRKARQRLIREKKKIEALLPLATTERRATMRDRLVVIDNKLGIKTGPELRDFQHGVPALSKIDGVGGLQFQAKGPPGVGRLVRIPFLITDSPDFNVAGTPGIVTTDGGTSVPAISNASVIVQSTARSFSGMVFQTPVLEWATLRIVGLQVSQRASPSAWPTGGGGFVRALSLRPFILVRQLQVGGGANLLPNEGYVDATLYSPLVPEFSGLRNYPIVRSPNNVSVMAAVVGQPGAVGVPDIRTDYQVAFSINLVCEVLEDRDLGRHIPGPYARRDAVARDAHRNGTGFVNP
jgi:hypothetical protein